MSKRPHVITRPNRNANVRRALSICARNSLVLFWQLLQTCSGRWKKPRMDSKKHGTVRKMIAQLALTTYGWQGLYTCTYVSMSVKSHKYHPRSPSTSICVIGSCQLFVRLSPYVLCVETYHPSYHLVDLWMYRELEDVSHSREEMVSALTALLQSWPLFHKA